MSSKALTRCSWAPGVVMVRDFSTPLKKGPQRMLGQAPKGLGFRVLGFRV